MCRQIHVDLERTCLTAANLEVIVVTDQPTTITFSNGETRTFGPETLARTGGTTPQLVEVLLALALGMGLVVRRGSHGGRRRA